VITTYEQGQPIRDKMTLSQFLQWFGFLKLKLAMQIAAPLRQNQSSAAMNELAYAYDECSFTKK
jgi:uncharacterized protein YqcC (DUF446 family)